MGNPLNTQWRFLDSGTQTGSYNMQLDETVAGHLLEQTGLHTVRLYRWKPWSISLGRNQNESDIDSKSCREQGIDIVRRPTGGRAILHAEELTYSVVMHSDGRGVLDVYNQISKALVRGLKLFGVDASLQKSQPNFADQYKHPSSVPCFTSSARYEIEWGGRKLVGSAQRRFRNGDREVVLQHGSILTGPAHRQLVRYLATSDDDLRRQIAVELSEKTVDLAEINGVPIDTDELALSIRRGFEMEWEVEFTEPETYTKSAGEYA